MITFKIIAAMGQWVNKKHLTQQDYNDIVGTPFITYHVAWVISSCLLQYLQYAPLYIRMFFLYENDNVNLFVIIILQNKLIYNTCI